MTPCVLTIQCQWFTCIPIDFRLFRDILPCLFFFFRVIFLIVFKQSNIDSLVNMRLNLPY